MGGERSCSFPRVQPPNTEMEPDVFAPLNETDTYGRSEPYSVFTDNADAEPMRRLPPATAASEARAKAAAVVTKSEENQDRPNTSALQTSCVR